MIKLFLKKAIFRFFSRLVGLDEKSIFFESYQGTAYACSPKAVYEYLSNHPAYSGYRFVWSFRRPEKYSFLESNRNTIVVQKYRLRYFRWIARSKFWVVNSIQPYHLVKKEGQVMVQTWHGTPLKRLRNDLFSHYSSATNSQQDMIRKNNQDTARFDYLVSPSPYCSKVFTSAFNLEGLGKTDILLEVGYPRNDRLKVYSPDDLAQTRLSLGIPKDKKVILYAPTWRDDQHKKGVGYTLQLPIDFDSLQRQLSRDYILLFRAHYYVAEHLDLDRWKGFVLDVSAVDDVNDLYLISDVLITDYSSVFFDFSNLGRPIIFYMYDLEHYKDKLRGFYIDTDDFPGNIVRSEEEIVGILNDLESYAVKHRISYKSWQEQYNPWDDGFATRRLVERVFGER